MIISFRCKKGDGARAAVWTPATVSTVTPLSLSVTYMRGVSGVVDGRSSSRGWFSLVLVLGISFWLARRRADTADSWRTLQHLLQTEATAAPWLTMTLSVS